MSCPRTGTAALAALLVAAACGGPPPEPPGPSGPSALAPLEASDRLYSDNGEGITDSVRIVVRDQATLQDVWSRATRHQTFPAPAPTLDFEEHMVVVVGAGRMTPQDRIRVDSVGIREVPDALGNAQPVLLVRVRTIQGCQRLDLDAYPVEIVRVPRFDGPVRFLGGTQQDPNCEDAGPAANRPEASTGGRVSPAAVGPAVDVPHPPAPSS